MTVIEARQLGGLNMDPVVCVQVSGKSNKIVESDSYFLSHFAGIKQKATKLS